MITTEAGAIVKLIKKYRNLTNKKIGDDFNVHENTVWQWTKGAQSPSFDLVCQICDYYGVSVDEARRNAKMFN